MVSFLPLKVAIFALNPLKASFDDRRMISDTWVGLEHGENSVKYTRYTKLQLGSYSPPPPNSLFLFKCTETTHCKIKQCSNNGLYHLISHQMHDIENKRDICYCFYLSLVGSAKKHVNKITSFYMDTSTCLL